MNKALNKREKKIKNTTRREGEGQILVDFEFHKIPETTLFECNCFAYKRSSSSKR